MISSLIFDRNRKVTNWIVTRILSEKIKSFGTDLEPTMANSAHGRVNLKFNNPVLE